MPPTVPCVTTRVRVSTGLVVTLPVDRQRISSIAHSHHPVAAPIFGVSVNRLLRRADRQPAARILDRGCGGEPGRCRPPLTIPTGTGTVWTSARTLPNAPSAAAERGLADRLTLHERDARAYVPDGDYDLALCVGSTHALGGFGNRLELAGRHVNADGIVMVGGRFWQVPPTPEALAALNCRPEGPHRPRRPGRFCRAGRLDSGVRPCQRRRRVGRLRVVVDRLAHQVGAG